MAVKAYQYKTITLPDRGHIDHPPFLMAMNVEGASIENVPCPVCGGAGHAIGYGWKDREWQNVGAQRLIVLLEREVEVDWARCPSNSTRS